MRLEGGMEGTPVAVATVALMAVVRMVVVQQVALTVVAAGGAGGVKTRQKALGAGAAAEQAAVKVAVQVDLAEEGALAKEASEVDKMGAEEMGALMGTVEALLADKAH